MLRMRANATSEWGVGHHDMIAEDLLYTSHSLERVPSFNTPPPPTKSLTASHCSHRGLFAVPDEKETMSSEWGAIPIAPSLSPLPLGPPVNLSSSS